MENNQNKNLRGLKLLIVDDERAVLSVLNTWLRDSGAEIQLSTSVPQAIEKLKSRDITLVICDVRMPGGNADDLLRWINSNLRETRPAVFLMSSHSEVQEYLACQMGCEAFLLKPLQKDVLFAEINRFCPLLEKQKAG